jgi:hypothetical protein
MFSAFSRGAVRPGLAFGLTALLALVTGPPASAGFQWVGDWSTTTSGTTTFTPADSGPSGPGASLSASVSTTSPSGGSASIQATRSFSLTGSPQGWDILTTNSAHVGTFPRFLSTNSGTLSAQVSGAPYNYFFSYVNTGGAGAVPDKYDEKMLMYSLADGTYTVTLSAQAGVSPFSGQEVRNSAVADLSFSISATPAVPEPAAALLVALGGAALAAARWRAARPGGDRACRGRG